METIRPMVFIPKAKLRYDKCLKKVYMDVSVEEQYLVCCKDCKKWVDMAFADGTIKACELTEMATKPDDYCSYAEAIDDEN